MFSTSTCEGWGQGNDSGCIAWTKPGQDFGFFLHADYDKKERNTAVRLCASLQGFRGKDTIVFRLQRQMKIKSRKNCFAFYKQNKGSCIVMPKVVHFKTFSQVTGKKSANHFGKEEELKNPFGKEK